MFQLSYAPIITFITFRKRLVEPQTCRHWLGAEVTKPLIQLQHPPARFAYTLLGRSRSVLPRQGTKNKRKSLAPKQLPYFFSYARLKCATFHDEKLEILGSYDKHN